MSMIEPFKSDSYKDGRTKQAFKDETDINRILARAQKGDAITHLAKHGAVYGDFTDFPDLLDAHDRLMRGKAIFDELPSEVRREFSNNPSAFFEFVNAPENRDQLERLIPGLAKPGDQLPEPRRTAHTQMSQNTVIPEQVSEPEPTDTATSSQ